MIPEIVWTITGISFNQYDGAYNLSLTRTNPPSDQDNGMPRNDRLYQQVEVTKEVAESARLGQTVTITVNLL